MKNTCRYLFFSCIIIIYPCLLFAKEEKLSFTDLSDQIDYYGFFDISRAQQLVDAFYISRMPSADSILVTAHCIYLKSLINYHQGINDSSIIPRINGIKKILDKNSVPFEEALLTYASSLMHYVEDDYTRSFMAALDAEKQFIELGDNAFVAKVLKQLGNICVAVGSYEMAEDYYNQSLTLTSGVQALYKIKMNIYNVWLFEGKVNEAIDSLSALIPACNQQRDTAMLISIYINLNACYLTKGEDDKAEEYYDEILHFLPSIRNSRVTSGVYQNMAVYYLNKNDLSKSKDYFNKAKAISFRDDNQKNLSQAYLGLSKVFKQTGQVDSAFIYLSLYNELNSKIVNRTNTTEVYRAYLSTALESANKELTIKEQQISINNKRLVVILVSAIAIISLIISWVIILQLQKRHSRQQALIKEAENKDLEERLQSKQMIAQLQEERIEFLNREITSNSLMLSNKNQVLQQIADVTKRLPGNRAETYEIIQIIKSNIGTDLAWENFMMHFEQVHPDFFNKLNALNKDLTPINLRVCAYLRIGLDQKQIAQILNISYGSIRTHCYRTKKKLGLPEDESLDEFIRNI